LIWPLLPIALWARSSLCSSYTKPNARSNAST
jgi:hypothetical protein